MTDALIAKIKTELQRLGKPHWLQAIQELAENFAGYPFDDPDSQAPAAEIHRILLDIPSSDVAEITDERFIHRLMHSDIFSFRALRKTPAGAVYWNPLHERYIDFTRYDATTQYQTAHEHPAPDIIRNWYYHKMRIARQN